MVCPKITQTAGRNALGTFAPDFAHYNDDVLFGENWNNQNIDVKTRSIITVVALMASGITDSSLKYHLQNAKAHGVTQKKIAAVITHAAFYAGWPKGWAVFNLAKEVWDVDEGDLPYEDAAMRAHAKSMVFPIGAPNDAYAKYFVGRSYLAPVSTTQVGVFNVTFEPGCRNNWHIHHASSGGGQILICVAGRGYYQAESEVPIEVNNPRPKGHGLLTNIPVSIVLGVAAGILFGYVLSSLFEYAHEKGNSIRQSNKTILVLGSALLLMSMEVWLEGIVSFSGLLAVMSMACIIQVRCRKEVTIDLSAKFARLWVAAEVILFVLVGAAVDIRYTFEAGGMAVLMILFALIFRSVGVFLCVIGTKLNRKEKLYCVIAYLPKATVQAAIGSVPLSLGLACGNIVLSVAVLSIIITAPLGAILMDMSYKKFLNKT